MLMTRMLTEFDEGHYQRTNSVIDSVCEVWLKRKRDVIVRPGSPSCLQLPTDLSLLLAHVSDGA